MIWHSENLKTKCDIFQAENGGDATTCCARPDAANNNHNGHNNHVNGNGTGNGIGNGNGNGGTARRGVAHSRQADECGSQVRMTRVY